MKKVYHGKSFLSGKGFYIAVAVCLLAIAVATTIAISRTVTQEDSQSLDLPSAAENITDVTNTQSEIPKTSSETDSSVTSSSADESGSAESQSDSNQVKQTTAQTVATEFSMPLSGNIINGYSNGELVKSETLGDWRTHDGWDIAASEATPVKACADGTVSDIKQDDMWGTTVTIDHGDGVESFYCGLNPTIQVKLDQTVAMGDVIGSVGDTNQMEVAEESHLHFAMKKDGKWVDPGEYIALPESQ